MNMEEMMNQARQFQEKLGQMQEELAQRTVSASVGGGMVNVTVNGRHELIRIDIDKDVINPDDPGMLQDLVTAAVNEAMKKAQEMVQAEMAKLTGGLKIPGLF